jgi:hypothetical protein
MKYAQNHRNEQRSNRKYMPQRGMQGNERKAIEEGQMNGVKAVRKIIGFLDFVAPPRRLTRTDQPLPHLKRDFPCPLAGHHLRDFIVTGTIRSALRSVSYSQYVQALVAVILGSALVRFPRRPSLCCLPMPQNHSHLLPTHTPST